MWEVLAECLCVPVPLLTGAGTIIMPQSGSGDALGQDSGVARGDTVAWGRCWC